jgi:hypothetical protein
MPDDNDFFKRLLLGEPEPRKKSLLDLVLEVNAAPTPPRSNLATLASLAGTPSALPPISGFGRLIGSPAPVPALPRVPFEVPPNGIKFGETVFSEPATFGGWLPMAPGLYVILTRDFKANPRPYRPLYFGMAADLAERVTTSHEKYDEWSRCSGLTGILVAHHTMSGSTEWQRANLEQALIRHYAPECNKTHNPFGF